MKKKVTNLIIIDASGSMSSKQNQVREGIIELLTEIKGDMNKKVKMTTIICQFEGADQFKVLLNTSKKKEINPELIADKYEPRGLTALHDAIGEGFNLVPNKQDGVFVNILTDGGENASIEYTKEAIKRMITDARKKKWGVTFMGTSESALNNAASLGIDTSNMYQFSNNSSGVTLSNQVKNKSRAMYYTSVMTATSSADIQVDGLIQEEE